jgi:hypothetical protein
MHGSVGGHETSSGRFCTRPESRVMRQSQARVAEPSALSSMWPIALAIADGRSGTGCRRPALGRRTLRTKAPSFPWGRKPYSYELLPACSWTHRYVPFLTGQKGDGKKPHQPALAHCVHVAGRDALRLTALFHVGATNRLSDSRHGAEGHTLEVPLCGAAPSETPHRERPGKELFKKAEESCQAVPRS